MVITRVTDTTGPTVGLEIESKRGTAAALVLAIGADDETGEFVGRDISNSDGNLKLYPAGTPDSPSGSPSYTFSTLTAGMTKDVAESTFTPAWTAAEADTLAAGRYVLRFELVEGGEVVERPFQGYWYHP